MKGTKGSWVQKYCFSKAELSFSEFCDKMIKNMHRFMRVCLSVEWEDSTNVSLEAIQCFGGIIF